MTLLYSLGIIILVSATIYYFIWKDRINDKKNLEKQWQSFLMSESLNDIDGIALHGDRLIWNKYLEAQQLDHIIEAVSSRTGFPKMKKLQNDAFNKKLHYDRTYPSPGSSGEKKQSW